MTAHARLLSGVRTSIRHPSLVHCFRAAICLVLAGILAGCETAKEISLTHQLWDSSNRMSSRPAPNPRMAVFAPGEGSDVLVVYDALDERKDRIERHGYFLRANEARVFAGKQPVETDPSAATNMLAVPIVGATNDVPRTGLAVRFPIATDQGTGLELYRDGRSEGAFPLPIFDRDIGPAARAALTPPAVMVDTVMVAAAVGTAGAFFWVMAGCPPFGSGHVNVQ